MKQEPVPAVLVPAVFLRLINMYWIEIIGTIAFEKIKGFFDPFCNNIIRDKSRYNHICFDRRERNRVRVFTM